MEWKVRCYRNDGEDNIIGAEVIAYKGNGDEISKIVLTDETQLNELARKLDNLDSTYVDMKELVSFLSNDGQKNKINASLFNGMKSDVFLKKTDVKTYSFEPDKHSSTSSTYGLGSTSEYGHVKLIDNLTSERYNAGEVLSSHQGYVLNDKINDLDDSLTPTKVETETFHHSKWKLYKSGNVVSLHIVAWQANSSIRNQYFNTNLVLPENCRPPQGVTIYIDDVVVGSQHIIIGDDCKIHAFIKDEGSGIFHGQASWITMEE